MSNSKNHAEDWEGFVVPLHAIPDPDPTPRKILIVGAGIAGIASALALAHELTPHEPNLQITIFERHDVLSTSGGAINLTPVAQRHLDRLGVLRELDRLGPDGGADVDAIEVFSSRSGRSLGSIDFVDAQGNGIDGYKGRRVLRIVLSLAMLTVVERHPNMRIVYGKKLASVTSPPPTQSHQSPPQTILHFDDNSSAAGDLILGCDGVHSPLRTQFVAPDRPSQYTGLSFIQTIVDAPSSTTTQQQQQLQPPFDPSRPSSRPRTTASTSTTSSTATFSSTGSTSSTSSLTSPAPFRTTGLALSRHGDLIASYFDRDHSNLFISAIVQIEESLLPRYRLDPNSDLRDRVAIHRALREEIRSRFSRAGLRWIREVANLPVNWILYPVYQVQPGGRWWRDRVMLLGDAAHAMPPRDESAAYALDDAIMFARILAHKRTEPIETVFREFEDLRRSTVEEAFRAASRSWATHRDMGFLEGRWKEWATPWMIWRSRGGRNAAWKFDAYDV